MSGVASAGPAMGILEPMLVRAYLRAGAALPAPARPTQRRWAAQPAGRRYLFAAGVAQQVVKADIASHVSLDHARLSASARPRDRLGVLLALVDRLTDLRLAAQAGGARRARRLGGGAASMTRCRRP